MYNNFIFISNLKMVGAFLPHFLQNITTFSIQINVSTKSHTFADTKLGNNNLTKYSNA